MAEPGAPPADLVLQPAGNPAATAVGGEANDETKSTEVDGKIAMKDKADVFHGLTRSASVNYYSPDLSAQVSTGPGLTTWRWRSAELTWRGPVDASQTMTL